MLGGKLGLKPGDRVLLVYLPSLDFIVAFLACLMAEIVPVPVFPPGRSIRGQRRGRLTWLDCLGEEVEMVTLDQFESRLSTLLSDPASRMAKAASD